MALGTDASTYLRGPSDSNPSTPHYLNMDYLLLQARLSLLESTRLLEASEIQLLKAQCEQERTQILTILMLSMENPRFAGYMLTGNRSMFLNTDASLAWVHHCPESHSPLHTMNQCYDRIPIFYKGVVAFVDIQPMITRSFPGYQDAGMYTPKQLSEFWENILMSAASRNALQKFSRELINPSMANSGPEVFAYYAPRTDFYVDGMISPGYFKNQFLRKHLLCTRSLWRLLRRLLFHHISPTPQTQRFLLQTPRSPTTTPSSTTSVQPPFRYLSQK